MVCGVCELFKGFGWIVCVGVFVWDVKVDEVKVVGVDVVGVEDFFEEVLKGNIDFDCCIVIFDMMLFVGCFGKVFGLCGMMLNLKVGIVMLNVGEVVKSVKGGVVEFCVEKVGVIYVGIGKVSFSEVDIVENVCVFVVFVMKVKLIGVKGMFLK